MEFKKGQKYRVIKDGCSLSGMRPIAPYTQQGWGMKLHVGDIITCRGEAWTFGDGVPAIHWADQNNKWLANDCTFEPSTGGMWHSRPAPDCLEEMP